jgi:Plant transposon protein
MADDSSGLTVMVMLMYLSLAVAALFAFESTDEEEEAERIDPRLFVEGLSLVRRIQRKHERWLQEAEEPPKKKAKYDYARARACIYQDYLGPDPLFGKYFERVFRVSRGIAETLMQICGTTHSFFTSSTNKVTGEPCIYPESKILMALKLLAYGVSPSAFMDYFQMSDQTGRKSLKLFCRIVANNPQLRQNYLRMMTKSDAMRVSHMHYIEFGVRGCVGCIDCMHIFWKNCPVAWQGQYQGKDGSPSIILEAVADYSTWIWHNRFGFPGTHNDINVWEQSSLLRSFIDGTFALLDFNFVVGNKAFNQLWVMADGIYPDLSRFVKTMSVPITKVQKLYSKWQESCRKSVERAFGILRRKFQILSRPIELFFVEDIRNVVDTCIILHSMMVELRLKRNEEEN